MKRDLWLGVELRHLAAVRAVAQERSFRGAAKRLGYVQSAVSQQVAFVERAVGARVIERSRDRGTVMLTPAGEVLLRHAERLFAEAASMKADLERLQNGDRDAVRVGVFHGLAGRIMPAALKESAAGWSRLAVTPIEFATDASIFRAVREGEIDLGFAYLPLEAGAFACREMARTPTVLAVRAESPLARAKRAPTLEEIAHLPLIARRSCRLLARLEGQLEAVYGPLNVVFRTDICETAQDLVAAGLGVALMPRLTIDRADDRIAVVELDDRLPSIAIGLFWHEDRQLGAAAQGFADLAVKICLGVAADDEARDVVAAG